jgi:hydroxymethylpyrimidine/phosphomethylpyrimidine kinase
MQKGLKKNMVYKALTIAGSDSGGGAGIQADLKTFAACGVYGMSVITAVTAQNTVGVQGVYDLPDKAVAQQIESVLSDIGAQVIKIGMLANGGIIESVVTSLQPYQHIPLVVDPVMVAKSGDALLASEAIATLKDKLLPIATVITPNLAEAEALTGIEATDEEGMREIARRLYDMGPRYVVVKGGHLEGAAVDVLFDGVSFDVFEADRIDTPNTHGTGCTFAAAIAAEMAKGSDVKTAVGDAKTYVTEAIRYAEPIGSGHGSVHHFHTLYREVEKRTVLDQLTAAARRLEEAHAGALIPEVQSNLGMGLTGARTFDDVAAFPGRLIRLHRDIRSVAPPEFAASTHVAKIVLTAMKHDPDKRAVMNIRYEEEMLAACRALNLSIASFDRHEEPKDVKNLEGSSLEWGTAQVIRETGEVPDIIYDIGDEGKEPMIRILGRDPGRIVDIVLAILERVRG